MCTIANEEVSLQTTSQHSSMFRSSNEGGEEAARRVFTSIARSDGAAAVVDYDGGVVKIGHLVWSSPARRGAVLRRYARHPEADQFGFMRSLWLRIVDADVVLKLKVTLDSRESKRVSVAPAQAHIQARLLNRYLRYMRFLKLTPYSTYVLFLPPSTLKSMQTWSTVCARYACHQ